MLRLVFGAAAVTVLLLTASCDDANNPSALVGHWLYESGYKSRKPENIELFKDGTGICDGHPLSWKVENKRLVLLASIAGIAADYKVSGYRLTLTYNDGDDERNATFVKKEYAETAKGAIIAAVKAKAEKVKKGSFTDARDNKTYKTVKLDKQIWMAENLNYETEGSKCYKNELGNCQKYGRLYNWETAMKACPKGWHLPSESDFDKLYNFVNDGTFYADGINYGDDYLKATNGWAGNGTDDYGFTALPGGEGDRNGNFYSVGSYGYWWGANEVGSEFADFWFLSSSYYSEPKNTAFDKTNLYSVRCVQN